MTAETREPVMGTPDPIRRPSDIEPQIGDITP